MSLIRFSCEAGALLGEAGAAERAALVAYAEDLGLAFQIADDLLDAESTPEALGKPTGQDASPGKATFVGPLCARQARESARALGHCAPGRLKIFATRDNLLS